MERSVKSRYLSILKAIIAVIMFSLIFLFTATSNKVTEAVIGGIKLCCMTLVPSLFPFLVISGILMRIGALQMLSKHFYGIMKRLFGVSGVSAAAVITGLICGFPSGAAVLTSEGKAVCSKKEGERTLFLSATASPAFVISGIGIGMLGSVWFGITVWVIHILSTVLAGIILKSIFGDTVAEINCTQSSERTLSLSTAAEAIRSAADSMLSVCATVIFFSVICGYIENISIIPDTVRCVIASFFELTSGVKMISKVIPFDTAIVMISSAVSWSGLSVFSQIILVTKGQLGSKEYFIGKMLTTLISAFLALICVKCGIF